MADWNDIKKAFERDAQKAENAFLENEQSLLKSVANLICSQKGVSTVQGYKPEDVIAFLEKPVAEIKNSLGSEWQAMEDDRLEVLVYSLSKKVKKSDSIISW